ncbi:MAG: type II toxin-antitoxin system Phd/YefM family antitoxin [Treponema sp.]|nr:type II toxin-antitoxin system Phd/YefM family antitoxin [Treponema sp.]
MINIVEDIKSISYVKTHTAEILRQVAEKNNPIVITQNGESKAVIMDVRHYQKIVDTLNLFKILSIGENDIKSGKIFTHDQLNKKIDKILAEE